MTTENEPIVAVDHAQILLIDPMYLPDDALVVVRDYLERRLAVLLVTGGDGAYRVNVDDDLVMITGPSYATFERADTPPSWWPEGS